jgi:hypothetical protein
MWPRVSERPPGEVLQRHLLRPPPSTRTAAQAGAGGLGRLAHLDRLDHLDHLAHLGRPGPRRPRPRLSRKEATPGRAPGRSRPSWATRRTRTSGRGGPPSPPIPPAGPPPAAPRGAPSGVGAHPHPARVIPTPPSRPLPARRRPQRGPTPTMDHRSTPLGARQPRTTPPVAEPRAPRRSAFPRATAAPSPTPSRIPVDYIDEEASQREVRRWAWEPCRKNAGRSSPPARPPPVAPPPRA